MSRQENYSAKDRTLDTLCHCRKLLLSKLKNENEKSIFEQKEQCEKYECDNQFLLNILNKLFRAKESLNPVIEEIIQNASNLTVEDYKSLKGSNEPICSVTTAQFAGAVEASKLLYEINEHLNEADKKVAKKAEFETNEFAMNAFVYSTSTVPLRNKNSSERISIDKELMQQLIELHDLLGDTIRRLKLSSNNTPIYSTKTTKSATRKAPCSPCCKSKSKRTVEATSTSSFSPPLCQQSPRGSKTSLNRTGRSSRTSLTRTSPTRTSPTRTSKTSLTARDKRSSNTSLKQSTTPKTEKIKSPRASRTNVTLGPIKCDPNICPQSDACPSLNPHLYTNPQPTKKKCCAKKSKSQNALKDAKKKEKREMKLRKKLEKQRQKELKRREKQARKGGKKPGGQKTTCCGKKSQDSVASQKSKSATYVRYGAPPTVNNIDEAKIKIMDCLQELSNLRSYLSDKAPAELDMENQLEIVGTLQSTECCERKFPHLHAKLNGIPIVLQLNKEALNTLAQTSPTIVSKCRCGPIELSKCPLALNTDLDYTPISQKASKSSLGRVSPPAAKASTSKTKSLPSVTSQLSNKKSSYSSSKKKQADTSSAILWKHPGSLTRMAETSLTNAQIVTTPETSITVFSTKKTKDGQKVRLSLTISPMGPDKYDVKTKSKTTIGYGSTRQVIPEKDFPAPRSKIDGFETDESDPGMPYMADNCSLPDFTIDAQKNQTTLTNSGIAHPDTNIQRQLQEMGLENILRVCKPAKCCRRTVINERPRNALPYPASLQSLPLDEDDLNRIKADIKRNSSNAKYINYSKYQTFNFETYTKFQRDDKFPWKIQIYEVRFFEFIKMGKLPGNLDKRPNQCKQPNKIVHKQPIKVQNKNDTNKFQFLSWLPNRETLNFKFLDGFKKRNFATTSVQTIETYDELDDDSLDVPFITRKPKVRKPVQFLNEDSSHHSHEDKPKPKRYEQSKIPINPYMHGDIACFNVREKCNKGVHFNKTSKLVRDQVLDKNRNIPVRKTIKKTSNTRKVEGGNKIVQKKASLLSKNSTNDSLIKLIPLQPYLVEKMDEDESKTDARSSKSSVYNSAVDKTDSRIVYKKYKSDDLYYITSNTNSMGKYSTQRGYTSLYKNNIFYPIKQSAISAYYNTIVTNNPRPKAGAACSRNANNLKQCRCSNKGDVHSPESLEKLKVNGIVPCYCSNCSIETAPNHPDTKRLKEYYDQIKLYNKMAVNTNESLESIHDDIERKNKKTAIRTGKRDKERIKACNHKLTGNSFEEFEIDVPIARNENIQHKNVYTTNEVTHNPSNVSTRKHCSMVKNVSTSKPSFLESIARRIARGVGSTETTQLVNKKTQDFNEKPSFYFQCEDDELGSVLNTKKTRLAARPSNLKEVLENTRKTTQNKMRPTDSRLGLPFITSNDVTNYAIPKAQIKTKHTLLNNSNSHIPQPFNYFGRTNKLVKHSQLELETSNLLEDEIDTLPQSSTTNYYKNIVNFQDVYNKKPLQNKNALLSKMYKDSKKPNGSIKRNTNTINNECIYGFTKMLDKFSKDISCNDIDSDGSKIKMNNAEKYVKHTYSSYKTVVDGQSRPGYISILKPTCGCPEITVFIPCYCDDNSIFGNEKSNPN